MSASSPGEDFFSENEHAGTGKTASGLVPGHAYSLISVKESSVQPGLQ